MQGRVSAMRWGEALAPAGRQVGAQHSHPLLPRPRLVTSTWLDFLSPEFPDTCMSHTCDS